MNEELGGYEHNLPSNMRTDTVVASAVIVLYAVLVAVLLPGSEYPRAFGTAAVVFATSLGFGRVSRRAFGRGPIALLSVVLVAGGATFVLAVPTFPAMGGTSPAAVPIGFVSVQAAILLWAVAYWRPVRPLARRITLLQAWRFGALAAAMLSAIAAIPVLIAVGAEGAAILLVFPSYFVGLLLAATLYWLLQPIAHLATGRYLIGVMGGSCLYAAMAPVVSITKHEALDPSLMLIIAALAGGYVGPAVALSLTDQAAAT